MVAYKDILGSILDAEIIVPKYSDVGNATGALAAKGVRRVDFLIRPASMAAPDWEYYVFSEKGRQSFYEYKDAIKYARETGQSMVMQYMEDAGLDPDHVEIDVKKDEIVPEGWDFPMETKIRIMGVWYPPDRRRGLKRSLFFFFRRLIYYWILPFCRGISMHFCKDKNEKLNRECFLVAILVLIVIFLLGFVIFKLVIKPMLGGF